MHNNNDVLTIDLRAENLADFLYDLDWYAETGREEMETAIAFWEKYDRRNYGRTYPEDLEIALRNLLIPVYGAVNGEDYVQEFMVDWLDYYTE